MKVIPNTSAKDVPRSKIGRSCRLAAKVSFIALVLAFLALLWPGWPLHPLAALATWRTRSQGLELHIRSPWLRLHPNLTLSLKAKSVLLGDPANHDALALDSLAVRWRLGDLFHARWSPESIQLEEAAVTLRAGEAGHLVFVALPSSSPAGAPAPAFTPADLPANLLPREGRAFNLTIIHTRLALPAGLPIANITTGPVTLTLGHQHAGYLDISGSLDLKVDARPGTLQFQGHLALVRDWLGKFSASLNASPVPTSPATRIAFTANRTDAAKPATVSLRINDCAPGDWLALLGHADLPAITGRVDAEFEASGDPVHRHLDAASARITTGPFILTQPALLVRPLTVTPMHLAFHTEDNGSRGTLEPFSTQAGPLALTCSGLTWASTGATVSGNGLLQLSAIPLTALIEWLPPAMLAKLPLTPAEASEIGLAATTITLAASGENTSAPPRLHVSTRTGLTLNHERLAIESEGNLDPATKQFEVQVVLPDFVQARWQLALLRRFPVPELAAPLRAEFNVSGHLPAALDDARWRVVAGQGHVIPKGPSLRWLARPFPITSFALSGRLNNDQKKLAIDQLDFVSGRAHLAFERTELQSPQTLITTSGPAPATVHFALKLEHWYAADFIPLLGPELQSMVAPAADDLAQIGLERLETGAELSFARLPWIDPALTALSGTQSAVLRIGEERLPADAVWKFDPASRRLAVSLHLDGLRPDRLKLASLKNLPIPPGAFDLAFGVNLDVSANPYAQSLDLMNLKADLRVHADGGRIRANSLLAADLPVKHLALAASARILPLRLDHLKAEADFDGPTLLIDDARLDLGDGGHGGLRLSLRELPLDWALARMPPAYKPALLKNTRVRGRLAKLDLSAEFPSPTAAATTPLPDILTVAADLRDLAVLMDNRPELMLPHLDVSGDLKQLDVRIDRASTDGITLVNFIASVTTPLTPARQAKAAGTVEADLTRVPALLAAAKPWVTLPVGVDLNGLGGQATLQFTASSPLDPAKIPAELKASATVTARQVTLPMLPAAVRLGPSAFTLATDIAGQTATGSFTWHPSSLNVAPWISGTPIVSATYSATAQAIDIHPQLDLAATVMDVPQLNWHKAVGLPAKILTDARFTPPTPTSAGHLTATVTTEGLIISPLCTRAEADLSDDHHPPLNLLPSVASLQLRDTRFGFSSLELDATRTADGATLLALRSPLIDLTSWITRFSDIILAWNKAHIPPPATATVVKTTPAPPTPPAATAIPVLNLPALNIQADIARIALTPARDLTRVTVVTSLRDGLPSSLKLTAAAGEKTTLDLQLDSATGRAPWHCNLVDLTGWLRAAAAPLTLLTTGPLPPDSPLETLRILPATFVSGDISLQGTADWRDLKNTVDGNFQIDHLALENEIKFLSKIAALVKKRVILHVPFGVFDVPSFTASPTSVSLKRMRIEGPLTLTSEHLDLDLVKSEIDMSGKVLGIGFEVAGPIADPRFYLTDKNVLIKGITTQDDFDF